MDRPFFSVTVAFQIAGSHSSERPLCPSSSVSQWLAAPLPVAAEIATMWRPWCHLVPAEGVWVWVCCSPPKARSIIMEDGGIGLDFYHKKDSAVYGEMGCCCLCGAPLRLSWGMVVGREG